MLAKSLGTTTPINMTRATVDGLRRLVRPEDVAELRGKRIIDVLPFPPRRTQARGGGCRGARGRRRGRSRAADAEADAVATEEAGE